MLHAARRRECFKLWISCTVSASRMDSFNDPGKLSYRLKWTSSSITRRLELSAVFFYTCGSDKCKWYEHSSFNYTFNLYIRDAF
jgi:hypothetical protein